MIINGQCHRIPRDEVEEIARVVYDELCEVQEGCVYTICGGYGNILPRHQ